MKSLPDFRIYVEIEDGRKGIFDLKPYLNHGVFRELRDVHYFNKVGILFGAVTWPHEQDIAPETLLAEMQPVESGSPGKEGNWGSFPLDGKTASEDFMSERARQ